VEFLISLGRKFKMTQKVLATSCLLVEVNAIIVGFLKYEGNKLKRMSHKVEFGACILKEY
jgi:hypothetical protein